MMPYVKSIVYPVNLESFKEQWVQGVCLQSSPSSCGPASAATLLNAAGYTVSERVLAKECFTSKTGTENWYIAKALRRREFKVEYVMTEPQPTTLHYPAIAGVRLSNNIGHFVAVLGETDNAYIVGDPLVGKRFVDKNNLNQKYHFTGFFMRVRSPRS